MATAVETLERQGIREWAQVLDSEYNYGAPIAQAESLLPIALAHVQASSPLGVWMREISSLVDRSTTEILSWNVLDLCRLTESQVQASSAFGVWMREMSVRALRVS